MTPLLAGHDVTHTLTKLAVGVIELSAEMRLSPGWFICFHSALTNAIFSGLLLLHPDTSLIRAVTQSIGGPGCRDTQDTQRQGSFCSSPGTVMWLICSRSVCQQPEGDELDTESSPLELLS